MAADMSGLVFGLLIQNTRFKLLFAVCGEMLRFKQFSAGIFSGVFHFERATYQGRTARRVEIQLDHDAGDSGLYGVRGLQNRSGVFCGLSTAGLDEDRSAVRHRQSQGRE